MQWVPQLFPRWLSRSEEARSGGAGGGCMELPFRPWGFTGRSSSWAASSGTPRSLGSGSWAHPPAARLCILAPLKRKEKWAGQPVGS